jgi:hypothetical protein
LPWPWEYDVQEIATHESGHSLFLQDLYDGGSSELTMYGYSSVWETKKRSLENDDKNGVKYIYDATPSVPSNCHLGRNQNNVGVYWNDNSNNEEGFGIERKTESGGTWAYINWGTTINATYYADNGLARSHTYYYRVRSFNGMSYISSPSNEASIYIPASGKDGGQGEQLTVTELSLQNVQNPFKGRTEIRYSIPNNEHISLTIYNASGQVIKTLVNENKATGWFTSVWDAKNIQNGIYFAKLQAGESVLTQRMILVK